MKKNKKQKRRFSVLLILGCIVFCIYFFVVIINQQADIRAANDKLSALERESQEQAIENEELDNLIENGGDEYIERIAREELGYVMPEEKVFYDISGN